jgi:uncharacterized protein YbaA (DUF1428 family)
MTKEAAAKHEPRRRLKMPYVNAEVMKDMTKAGMPKEMPFDVTRMVYGGFKVSVGG